MEDLQDELADAFSAGLRGADGALDRVPAAEMLLSRVHGRPKETQQVEVQIPEDWAMLGSMSTPELAALYRKLVPDRALIQPCPLS